MTERFQKAYNSLIRAFFEGTLAKGTCIACACGNIIFDAIDAHLTKEEFSEELDARCSGYEGTRSSNNIRRMEMAQKIWADKREAAFDKPRFQARKEFSTDLNVAGYTATDFAEIENAFEDTTRIFIDKYKKHSDKEILEDQYNGLCAVVDVLMKLDEIEEGKEEYKQKFREHPSLQST